MLALAFECAGQGLSAALFKDGEALGTIRETMDRGQPARLVPALHDLLASADQDAGSLNRVACTLGPGGFTGIRLGISVGLGLARATGATFYGVNAFDVYAAEAGETDGLCITVESRRAEVFVRAYAKDGVSLLLRDGVYSVEEVQAKGPFRQLIGSAAGKILPNATQHEPNMAIVAQALSKPDVSAAYLIESQDKSSPIYLRAPEIGQKLSP